MSHYLTIRGLGRAIAYYPQLGIHLGNPLAGIFLSQLIYWHDKTDCELGVYKTSEEWQKETGLSYRQQSTARTLLKNLGILNETEKRLEHKIYFKLNIEAFDVWFEKCISFERNGELQNSNSGNTDNAIPERRKRISGEYESAIRGNTDTQSVIHKITTENTTDIQTHTCDSNFPKESEWQPEHNFLLTVIQTSVGDQAQSVLDMPDYEFHLGNFNAHWENKTELTENQRTRKFAQWLILEFKKPKSGTTQKPNGRSSQVNNRNVNDKWASEPKMHVGDVKPIELPEGFV